jgi:hypothetical protein
MSKKSRKNYRERLICRSHQSELKDELRRKFRLVIDEHGRAQTYSLERTTPSYGLRSAGNMLVRAALYKGPFLPADAIRRYRFESNAVTDNPDEMTARYSREKELELKRKLNRLLGRE